MGGIVETWQRTERRFAQRMHNNGQSVWIRALGNSQDGIQRMLAQE